MAAGIPRQTKQGGRTLRVMAGDRPTKHGIQNGRSRHFLSCKAPQDFLQPPHGFDNTGDPGIRVPPGWGDGAVDCVGSRGLPSG